MKSSVRACFLFFGLLWIPSFSQGAGPVLVGLGNKHPLSEPQIGELLLGELKCLACHTRKGSIPPLEKAAPDLSDIGFRVAPDYLRAFIFAPSVSHAGSTMPDILGKEPEVKRKAIAEAITHFLVSQSARKFQGQAIPEKEAGEGKTLFHTIGCIACHSPRDENGKETTTEGVVELGHAPSKYSLASLSEFLFQPARVRPSGRMPDMKLTQVEAKAVASYLIGKVETVPQSLKPREDLVSLGKTYFQEFNCSACHKLGDLSPGPVTIELLGADLTRGCLDKAPGKAPRFDLAPDQIKAIRSALSGPSVPATDQKILAMTLTAFNCIACHIRDDFGGIPADRNLHFKTTANNLGEEGRIPPPLTLAGAKLQTVWMKKVLFDSQSVRPYMVTRMPQYGEPNLRHLPDLFARLDHLPDHAFSFPNHESNRETERNQAKLMRDAGRELLGDKSLYCVACHNFNGKTPQNHGIELMTSHERLKPGWFYLYMRDPGAFRPRTVMPASWPGGKAAQPAVLNGDTDKQIDAIWYFLSLGTSAPDPSGVRPSESKLAVTEGPRTYRGRSSVAGYRGIAVGFPEKINYAFNAETGTLSAIWKGDYIRVDRSGQGSGGFNPSARSVQLAQDVSFFALADEQAPWPLRPVMTKEAPVNPDPLYPKNRGYQFKGYYLDDGLVPSFMYRTGDIEIEDRITPGKGAQKDRLIRTLSFQSAPGAQSIWFRALTGKIEKEAEQIFKNQDIRITIPQAKTILRPTGDDKGTLELLLKLDIPQGQSKAGFTYELLK